MLSDDISPKEMRVVLRQLVDEEAFRLKCETIGHLAGGPEEDRQKFCRSLVSILMHKVVPPEEEACDMRHMVMRSRFHANFKRLPPEASWYPHLIRKNEQLVLLQDGGVLVSKTLWSAVRAVEDLWNVRGHYTQG